MKSSLRQPEQARKQGGIPLRPLALSLVLHALVLGGLAPEPESAAGATAPSMPLHAMLRPQAAIPAPAAALPAPSLGAGAAYIRRAQVPASVVPDAASAATRAAPEAVASAAPERDVPGSSPAADAAPDPATAAPVASVGERGPDAAGLRQYRLALAAEAHRFRRYPEAARREGLAGTAEVRVTVAAVGAQRHAELARSSGHAALDAAALEMLQRAAAQARLPASLEGNSFAVLLPVVFEVEE